MTAALLFLFAASTAALAPPETTILDASIVTVDRARGTITVRVDDGTDGRRTRQMTVAPTAVAGLARLKAGNAVLLTLRGGAVVDIKMAAGGGGRVRVVSPGTPAAAGPQQRIPQLPPGASSPASRGVPQLPPGSDPPQGRPIPQVAPSGGVKVIGPSPGISPAGVAPTRPAISPVAVASPKSPGTPRPVVLPSDPPPTPIPSPLP